MITTVSSATDAFDDTVSSEDLVFVNAECGVLPQISDINFFCTPEELREHFHAYGEIESINVKTDPNTGRSRGFAFIVFSQADSIDKVCAFVKPH
jgi:RNA-binding proteins (RRM domain)